MLRKTLSQLALHLAVLCSLAGVQCQSVGSIDPSQPVELCNCLADLAPADNPAAPGTASDRVQPTWSRHLSLAQSAPLDLLEAALARWEQADGYRLTFRSQERLDGVLGGLSVIQATYMRQPRAVSFHWLENAGRVDRLLWMPARYDGKLVVHPTGAIGQLLKAVRVDPEGPQVRSASRRPPSAFGLASTLRRIVEDYRKNLRQGTLQAECLGLADSGSASAPAIVLKRVSTDPASESRTLLVWLDAEDSAAAEGAAVRPVG